MGINNKRYINVWKWVNKQIIYIQTDIHTDRYTDRHTDRQAHLYKNTYIPTAPQQLLNSHVKECEQARLGERGLSMILQDVFQQKIEKASRKASEDLKIYL